MDKIHTFGDQNEQDEEGLSICHIQNKNCSKKNISNNRIYETREFYDYVWGKFSFKNSVNLPSFDQYLERITCYK